MHKFRVSEAVWPVFDCCGAGGGGMSAGLRAGYKQTDVGVIPEDWDVSPISTLTTDFRGGAPLKPSDFTTLGVKVLPKGGVGRTGVLRIADKDIQYCSREYANGHPRNQVDRAYTIVVLRDLVPSGPSIGLMVEIGTDERFVLAQGVYGFKVDSEKADARYLIQLSNTRWYRNLANGIMVGSTQVHITNTAYKKAELPVPPLPEQRAIAAALSDVDALLGGLERLIAKKRDLKQAAMQQLLTGQTRLPGFSRSWEVKRLGELAEMGSGGTPLSSVPAYYDGKIPWVAISDMTKGGKIIESTERNLSALGLANSAAQMFPIGTVLYAMYASLGECSIAGVSLCTSQAILGIQPKSNLSADFLYYYLTSLKSVVKTLGQQGTQSNLNKGMVQDFRFSVPSVPEQTAIAAILSDMEIGRAHV